MEDFNCPWTHGHLRLPPTESPSYFAMFCIGPSPDSSGDEPFLAARMSVVFLQLPMALSQDSQTSPGTLYLSHVIWVGTAECYTLPQNMGVSRSFPVAGWEHGTLDLSHTVVWITWTRLFRVKITIHSATVWASLISVYWGKILSPDISFSILALRAGFILVSNLSY